MKMCLIEPIACLFPGRVWGLIFVRVRWSAFIRRCVARSLVWRSLRPCFFLDWACGTAFIVFAVVLDGLGDALLEDA